VDGVPELLCGRSAHLIPADMNDWYRDVASRLIATEISLA
jgi:hypothetical protein